MATSHVVRHLRGQRLSRHRFRYGSSRSFHNDFKTRRFDLRLLFIAFGSLLSSAASTASSASCSTSIKTRSDVPPPFSVSFWAGTVEHTGPRRPTSYMRGESSHSNNWFAYAVLHRDLVEARPTDPINRTERLKQRCSSSVTPREPR